MALDSVMMKLYVVNVSRDEVEKIISLLIKKVPSEISLKTEASFSRFRMNLKLSVLTGLSYSTADAARNLILREIP